MSCFLPPTPVPAGKARRKQGHDAGAAGYTSVSERLLPGGSALTFWLALLDSISGGGQNNSQKFIEEQKNPDQDSPGVHLVII